MNAPLTPSPLNRHCMRDKIRDVLIQRIQDGTYPSGERLIELNLAREFKVSQSPVREALRELETMGLVTSRRYCGTRVRQIQLQDLVETYQMRALIEQRAAELAVPCPDNLLDELSACLDRMSKAASNADTSGYLTNAIHFHRLIVLQSDHKLFLQTWDNLDISARAHATTLHIGTDLSQFIDVHANILQALRSRDGVHAGKLLRDMLNGLASSLLSSRPA